MKLSSLVTESADMKGANDVPLAGDADSEKQAPLLKSAGAAVYAGEQQPDGANSQV